MKIKLMSDLHMEFGSSFDFNKYAKTNKQKTLILAGDIESRTDKLESFIHKAAKAHKNVVMVAGNHEFYGNKWENVMDMLWKLGDEIDNFYFLENETIKLDGVSFIGATLWSSPNWGVFNQISDHFLIKYEDKKITSDQITEWNQASIAYIKDRLENIPGKKVVVTHFGPDPILMDPHWRNHDELNTYFWSKGFDRHFHYADMWLYGHTHDSGDIVLDGCRCVCNPYGYETSNKNWGYRDNLVFEV